MQKERLRQHIMASVEANLDRLQTDSADLCQIYRVNHHIPIAKTLSTLNDVMRSSKIRYLGSSNFDVWHLCEAE